MKLFCPECRASYDDSVSVCPEDGTRLYRLDPADDPLVGAVLDERFRVDWLIGQGGMGAVYRGMQLSINRQVAIKVLRTEFVDREIALELFFREAKVISEMTHPNIVRLIEFGQDKERDLLYLVMELVESSSLSDLLKEGRFKASFALEVAYQVCGALTEPHANDIIHRDLKPDNLLIGARSDGTLETKVLDFGIARALQRNTRLTQTGMICGTPAYMAPEQSRDRKVDPRTDLYALGVMLYEMLAGRPPFMAQSSLQIMLKHIQEEPPSLREVLPAGALPEGIESLVYRLIAKDPAARPSSAREVRTQIEQLRSELDLEPVRLDTERDKDVLFADWVMPAMPTSDELERGNTLGLVKETDLFAKTGDDEHSQADTVAENAPTQGLSGESDELVGEFAPDTEHEQVAATTPVEHPASPKVREAAGANAPGEPDPARKPRHAAGVATADASGSIEAQPARASANDQRTGESRAVPEAGPAQEPAGATTRPGVTSGVSNRTLISVAALVAVAVFGLSGLLFHLISDDAPGAGKAGDLADQAA
ncbi:MAG: protein kinase domain-containing protein, partial [Persicimonas sp.]